MNSIADNFIRGDPVIMYHKYIAMISEQEPLVNIVFDSRNLTIDTDIYRIIGVTDKMVFSLQKDSIVYGIMLIGEAIVLSSIDKTIIKKYKVINNRSEGPMMIVSSNPANDCVFTIVLHRPLFTLYKDYDELFINSLHVELKEIKFYLYYTSMVFTYNKIDTKLIIRHNSKGEISCLDAHNESGSINKLLISYAR